MDGQDEQDWGHGKVDVRFQDFNDWKERRSQSEVGRAYSRAVLVERQESRNRGAFPKLV